MQQQFHIDFKIVCGNGAMLVPSPQQRAKIERYAYELLFDKKGKVFSNGKHTWTETEENALFSDMQNARSRTDQAIVTRKYADALHVSEHAVKTRYKKILKRPAQQPML